MLCISCPIRHQRVPGGTCRIPEAISARSAYSRSNSSKAGRDHLSKYHPSTTMTAIRLLRAHLPRSGFIYRGLSTRASRVLSALDLPVDSVIPGVYDGQWKGSGEVVESKCPATGEVIGRIRTVSLPSWLSSTLSYPPRQPPCDDQLPNCRWLISGNTSRDPSSDHRFERSFPPSPQDARSKTRRDNSSNKGSDGCKSRGIRGFGQFGNGQDQE